ncbi:metalloregulator ArsR/SmtB family transcription factor [Mycobacterium sp. NPDC006124]|uniref:ArsR/SmtB family transcription factor n=1 Tax=Mycobacterium sp. NPDC006124 TaxID=3156729 RepID=UPI0033A86FA7
MPVGQPSEDGVSERLIQDTAGMFAMLSATVRLHLVWLLSLGERDVGTLAEETGQSMATVSHHLGKLKLAGFVDARRDGRRQVYFVSDALAQQVVRLAMEAKLDEAPRRRGRRSAAG